MNSSNAAPKIFFTINSFSCAFKIQKSWVLRANQKGALKVTLKKRATINKNIEFTLIYVFGS